MALKKKYESKGYTIGKKTAVGELKQACVYLSPDVVSFMDDFAYETKKARGTAISASAIVRAAVRAFSELPRDEQLELLGE